MFTPSNMLLNYLNAQPRDMFDIIGALMGYINADPNFKTNDFEEAIQYVFAHGVTKQELFADFDPDIEFVEDQSKWNEEYYSYARVYLKDNFCEKRIAHVKAVARKLHPIIAPVKPAAQVKPVTPKTTQTTSIETPKKARSQQDAVGKSSTMPTATKVLIALGVIVLLALVIILIASIK